MVINQNFDIFYIKMQSFNIIPAFQEGAVPIFIREIGLLFARDIKNIAKLGCVL